VDERELLGEPTGRPLEGGELQAVTREIASNLRCPICQGLSVADSPTASAQAMLDQVRDLLEQGYTTNQIFAYFEGAYGEFVLLTPRADGFNLVVWLGPIVVLLAGITLLAVRFRRSSSTTTAAASEGEELDPYLERVREDLSLALPPQENAKE
jgi:cytochrome c-type biogenesis protein CcmH